jgi:hypothetical protein
MAFRKRITASDMVDLGNSVIEGVIGQKLSFSMKNPMSSAGPQPVHKSTPLRNLHVKHPPGSLFGYSKQDLAELPSLYRDGEVDEWGRIPLDDMEWEYIRTQDRLLVLEALVLAHDEKLYPPMWVLDLLYTAFKEYLSDRGCHSLDHYLGIVGNPKQGSSFKQRAKEHRDLMLALHISWYAFLKQCSLEKAAAVVARFWNAGVERGSFNFGYGLDKPLDASTLHQNYVRKWRQKFMCDEKYGSIQCHVESLTDEERKQFLARFDT